MRAWRSNLPKLSRKPSLIGLESKNRRFYRARNSANGAISVREIVYRTKTSTRLRRLEILSNFTLVIEAI
jgi:hypothetical protein